MSRSVIPVIWPASVHPFHSIFFCKEKRRAAKYHQAEAVAPVRGADRQVRVGGGGGQGLLRLARPDAGL